MNKVKSCGCIIIDDNKVLLVYEKYQNFWGFPKGHVEGNETEQETALRETKEEVGIDVEIVTDYRFEFKYMVEQHIEKTCVLLLARPLNKNIKNQESEILKSDWYTIEEALTTLPYQEQKQALKQAIIKQKST